MRFIHTSDWQLGMTRHFLSAEAQARFAQDRIDAIRTLGRLAQTEDAAFMVVAGDVFESNQVSAQTVGRSMDALADVPVPVFLLPGNHDPLNAASVYRSAQFGERPDHIHLIENNLPLAVPGVEGVEIVGAPWTSKRPVEDLCARMLAELRPAGETLRIAVAHGQVDCLSPDTTRVDNLSLAAIEAALQQGQIHYLALGDRHSATRVGATQAVWYSGAPVATDFTELNPNRALLVDIEPGQETRVREHLIGDWHFVQLHHPLTNVEDVSELATQLDSLQDKQRSLLKLSFEGTVNLATAAALDTLLDSLNDRFAGVIRRQRTDDLVILPDQLDEDSLTLGGYARACWCELLDQARGDGVEADTARDALSLLYRLAQGDGRT